MVVSFKASQHMSHLFLSNWSCEQCWTSGVAQPERELSFNVILVANQPAVIVMVVMTLLISCCHSNGSNDTVDQLLS